MSLNIFFVGCEPECEEQEKPFNKWHGGETSALELLETRLMIERTVSLIT